MSDLSVDNGNIYLTNGEKEFSTLNGKGNLVVGVNKISQKGSHNVAIGGSHTLGSYGGLIAGYSNTVSDAYASVIGGMHNTASGFCSSVTGGKGNMAIGEGSTVSGGYDNSANDVGDSISGGRYNNAYG